MIPQRVAIEGFLSYREQVELSFDGASIWMLTGENGAGKSSVFDAISFALYGVHRGTGSRTAVKDLINHHCDKLAVEFDFLLGNDCYRVRRTVSRSGDPTFQAIHLSGPNPPNRGRTGSQPVLGTDSRSGLNQWVKEQLGLDAEAFKMAVLLEQGKSEALLAAKPEARHELLSQLVDLSRYEGLHKRAKDRRDDAQATVKRHQAELATLSPVADEQIAAQAERAANAKVQVQAARSQLEQLQALKVHAEQWSALSRQRQDLLQKQELMRSLIANGEAIERDALRLEELQTTLPALRSILQYRQSQEQHQREAETQRQNEASFALKVAELKPLLENAQGAVARWLQEQTTAQIAAYTASQRLSELAEPMAQLKNMERLRQEIDHCDDKLAAFPDDLDCQAEESHRKVEELMNLRLVLPDAQRYTVSRNKWHGATVALNAALQEQGESSRRVAKTATCLNQARAYLEEVRSGAINAQSRKAVAHHALEGIQKQLERFEEVGTESNCPYCGQALSEEHIAGERIRLGKALADSASLVDAATSAEGAALVAQREAEARLQSCEAEQDSALKAQRQSEFLCQKLTEERRRAEAEGWQALERLRENNLSTILLPQADKIALCFAHPEPADGDLAALMARVSGYAAVQASLKTLQQQAAERDGHRISRTQFERQYLQLAETYPEAGARAIRAEHKAVEMERLDAEHKATGIASTLDDAQRQLKVFEQRMQHIQANRLESEQRATTAEALAIAARTYVQNAIDALPTAWQTLAHEVEDAQLAAWEAEVAALRGADARYDELRHARTQVTFLEERLTELNRNLEAIPEAARQSLEVLHQEEEQARAIQEAGERDHQRLASELQELETRQRRVKELSAAARIAEKKASLYNELFRYLGRDYLQRFLLQQAEKSIVALANGVLDRCSGGTLSMELRPNDENGGSAQRAFDLMVENHATKASQDRKLPAWLLSGSQRFRVAISLALGIGQYASENGQRIESVIIDEGFGSLDRQGLRDMEDALRDLSGMLGRIILVSHQDDFARAFPHRYAIQLEDGASQARLVDDVEIDDLGSVDPVTQLASIETS
jgi:DNA repair exonuclease SbcCD ATPase subunit